MESRPPKYPPAWLAWSLWGIGVCFYLMGFYQRVAPAVMTSELMREFSISAASLGNLSGFYFYSYVAMQIPTGLLADHWGPRKLLASGAVVAGAGSLLFALAPALVWANLGRLLIGGSVAVAYVALLKLAGHWLPARRFSLASGLALFWGVVGAVGAGVPLRLLVDSFGWRPVMLASGLLILLLAAAAWIFIRDDPAAWGYASHFPERNPRDESGPGPWAGLRRVLQYGNTWLLLWAGAGLAGPVLSFGGLWGVPFLQARYQVTPAQAAAVCSLLLLGLAVGGTAQGVLSDRWGRRKPLFLAGSLTAAGGWALMIFLPSLPPGAFVGLILLTGLASGIMVTSFAWGKESVPLSLGGTVAGVINMGIMLGPTILQPAIGWMLDARWTGQTLNGVRIYSLQAYQAAFSLMLAWSLLAVVLGGLAKETHCEQMA